MQFSRYVLTVLSVIRNQNIFCSLITGKTSFLLKRFGSHLLSHTVSSAVPSAVWVLTIVFGMGTGVTPKRIATEMFCVPRTLIIKQQMLNSCFPTSFFLRKEVIQPHLPIRLPCYDFTPVIGPAFGSSLPLLSTIRFATSCRILLRML